MATNLHAFLLDLHQGTSSSSSSFGIDTSLNGILEGCLAFLGGLAWVVMTIFLLVGLYQLTCWRSGSVASAKVLCEGGTSCFSWRYLSTSLFSSASKQFQAKQLAMVMKALTPTQSYLGVIE
jgi:hypothetical protein